MTEQEINTWIAEKVMGWEKNEMYLLYYNGTECTKYSWLECAVGKLHDPYNNIAQALEALEVWDELSPLHSYEINSQEGFVILKFSYNGYYDSKFGKSSKPLVHAICDALVKATGGKSSMICGAKTALGYVPVYCVLEKGHDGDHETASGYNWAIAKAKDGE